MTIPAELRNQIKRLFFADHLSINGIAENLGIHHETVRRAINHEAFKEKKEEVSKAYWVDYDEIIRKTLTQYPKLPCTRLRQILVDKGASPRSVDSLRRYVKGIRSQVREAFIKRSPLAGEEAQVDWAHFGSLECGGAKRKLYCFVMVLSWSRYTFAKFTFDLKTETFLNCHSEAFRYFGGVPRALLYDNLKSVVLEREGTAIRFNPMTLDFAGHYNFEPRACSPYRGNEKGRVERKIRYLRENFFAARPLADIDTLNAELSKWLEEVGNTGPWPENKDSRVQDKFLEEHKKLLSLPEFHPILEISKTVRAGKYAHIAYDLNTYSIPPDYTQRTLLVRASHSRVRVYADAQIIAEHPRAWGKGEEVFCPRHRGELIAKKRLGATQAQRNELIAQVPELEEIFHKLADRGEPLTRSVHRLGQLEASYGLEAFKQAIEQALDRGSCSPESIALILRDQSKGEEPSLPKILPCHPINSAARSLQVKSHPLHSYDNL